MASSKSLLNETSLYILSVYFFTGLTIEDVLLFGCLWLVANLTLHAVYDRVVFCHRFYLQ